MPDKNSKKTPYHIAIIPDGNRRWARKRGLKSWEGHLRGIGAFAKNIAWTAFDSGARYLTIWGGSYDNLTKRSRIEIRMLNEAYRRFAKDILEDEEIRNRGIRVSFIGEWRDVLEGRTIEILDKAERATRGNKNNFLTILIAYNGDREMLEAINRLIRGDLGATAKSVMASLWTGNLPPVDLVIRTGGEYRLSAGFMMWNIQYAELYFSPKMWPDFNKRDLLKAIHTYSARERRFGK